MIRGWSDGAAIAAGASLGLPWCAIDRSQKIVIEPAGGGDPVGRFPIAFSDITTHPNGRAWAGSARNHLYIITLDGTGS